MTGQNGFSVISGKRRNDAQALLALSLVLTLCASAYAKWQPADGPLMTRWAAAVTPQNAHREYPRPQFTRHNWLNLNGLWDYVITPNDPNDKSQPKNFAGKILVPFPAESALSGVMKTVSKKNLLWYKRTFQIPRTWAGKRILLNFGAVDWETTVWINATQVGTHRGGYDPFTFDITDALADSGAQQILMRVWDPTDKGTQPKGKQTMKPGGIQYTAVTGIWQTVWLEPVDARHIESIKIIPNIDTRTVRIKTDLSKQAANLTVAATATAPAFTTGRVTAEAGRDLIIAIPNAQLWSPQSPYLYDLNIQLTDATGRTVYDSVKSYFGMRKISMAKDKKGINRLFLNNKFVFQFGPLDQGWWPDGLYTAPSDEALKYDIEVLKQLGCNMLRKHVKVEPQRFYYWCDKLGLLLWQDMPNGDRHIRSKDLDIIRSKESSKQFEFELKRLVETHYNSPAIIMWVPFNEGWGQYDTERVVNLLKQWDPTRLVNNASGWTDRRVGDVHDVHKYPGPLAPVNEIARAAVLGEFGGLGLPIPGHTWQQKANWGYRKFTTRDALTNAYIGLIDKLRPLVAGGLSAAVYTQTTDVEVEVNGLMTYDRAMIKADAERITAANKSLYDVVP